MTHKALAGRIAEVLFNEPATLRGAGAPQPEGLARILAGCFVTRRSKTTAGILPPHAGTQPKFAAALLYQPQTWCTNAVTGPLSMNLATGKDYQSVIFLLEDIDSSPSARKLTRGYFKL
jgi:hypothetical protein